MRSEQPTVLGYMKSQPEVLDRTYRNKDVFVKPFVEYFLKNDIKKIIFFGSGTSYNVSNIAAYYFNRKYAGICQKPGFLYFGSDI